MKRIDQDTTLEKVITSKGKHLFLVIFMEDCFVLFDNETTCDKYLSGDLLPFYKSDNVLTFDSRREMQDYLNNN